MKMLVLFLMTIWYILRQFGTFYVPTAIWYTYFVVICYIHIYLFPFLVCCTMKDLATLYLSCPY
jgi:hypothetical protein